MLAFSTLIAITACAEPGGAPGSDSNHPTYAPSSASPPASPLADGPVATRLLVWAKAGKDRFEALLSGHLGVDARGCVTLNGDTLVAPKGSTLDGDGRTVIIEGVGTFRLGEELPSTGGGYEEYADPSDIPSGRQVCSGTDFAVLTP